MIRLAILGSTGSIGQSALEIVRRHPERFRVVALTAHRSGEELARQVLEFGPDVAVLGDPRAMGNLGPDSSAGVEWRSGAEAVAEAAALPDVDVVLNALVGAAGLEATLAALESGKRLALANKESLVAGGPLVLDALRRGGGELIPIDSEHSAILQCLAGHGPGDVERMVLTASGGPFRGWNRDRLAGVGPSQALQHPTWSMGAKISVDSATLANKALEVIEAHFLYDIPYERIDAVVHPQSIIHSFVEFRDGSVMAQLGDPNMELPILYALTYPQRTPDPALRTFDPVRWSELTFQEIDHDAFRLFGLGVGAGRSGGGAPAVFNAANEVAVEAFIQGEVGFLEMADVVDETLQRVGGREYSSLPEVLELDREAREAAGEAVRKQGNRRTGGIR